LPPFSQEYLIGSLYYKTDSVLRQILYFIVFIPLSACTTDASKKGADSSVNTIKQEKEPIETTEAKNAADPVIQPEAKAHKYGEMQNSITNGAPEITALPFGPKGWPDKIVADSNFYFDLIGQNLWDDYDQRVDAKLYQLPPVNSIKYIQLQHDLDNYLCNGKPVDSVLKLTKYRHRLPDAGKYKIYYMCNSGNVDFDYPPDFIKYCIKFIYQKYGYLILYEPKTRHAVVINIYHFYYVDSVHERTFYIDKNYNIHILDQSWTDGDEGSDGKIPAVPNFEKRRTITITANAEIEITEGNSKQKNSLMSRGQ
jgi:hypothetical protein